MAACRPFLHRGIGRPEFESRQHPSLASVGFLFVSTCIVFKVIDQMSVSTNSSYWKEYRTWLGISKWLLFWFYIWSVASVLTVQLGFLMQKSEHPIANSAYSSLGKTVLYPSITLRSSTPLACRVITSNFLKSPPTLQVDIVKPTCEMKDLLIERKMTKANFKLIRLLLL